jgi:phage FluMu protein Com
MIRGFIRSAKPKGFLPMPIEFRCSNCNRLLRTADDTAGKQAKCPECATIVRVPESGTAATPFTPPAATPPDQPPVQPAMSPSGQPELSASPFGASSPFPPPPPPLGDPSHNPYASPSQSPYPQPVGYPPVRPAPFGDLRSYALGRVAPPAIALMVISGINMAVCGLGMFAAVLRIAGVLPANQFNNQMGMPNLEGVNVATGLVLLAISAFVFICALKMKNLSSYALAMTGSILSIAPCTWPCCLLGFAFGIWGIVVLSDANVKAAFEQSVQGPYGGQRM